MTKTINSLGKCLQRSGLRAIFTKIFRGPEVFLLSQVSFKRMQL